MRFYKENEETEEFEEVEDFEEMEEEIEEVDEDELEPDPEEDFDLEDFRMPDPTPRTNGILLVPECWVEPIKMFPILYVFYRDIISEVKRQIDIYQESYLRPKNILHTVAERFELELTRDSPDWCFGIEEISFTTEPNVEKFVLTVRVSESLSDPIYVFTCQLDNSSNWLNWTVQKR